MTMAIPKGERFLWPKGRNSCELVIIVIKIVIIVIKIIVIIVITIVII